MSVARSSHSDSKKKVKKKWGDAFTAITAVGSFSKAGKGLSAEIKVAHLARAEQQLDVDAGFAGRRRSSIVDLRGLYRGLQQQGGDTSKDEKPLQFQEGDVSPGCADLDPLPLVVLRIAESGWVCSRDVPALLQELQNVPGLEKVPPGCFLTIVRQASRTFHVPLGALFWRRVAISAKPADPAAVYIVLKGRVCAIGKEARGDADDRDHGPGGVIDAGAVDGRVLGLLAAEETVMLMIPREAIQGKLPSKMAEADALLELLRNKSAPRRSKEENNTIGEFLQSAPFFEEHDVSTIRKLVSGVEYMRCTKGDVLVRPDEMHENLYVILSGHVGAYAAIKIAEEEEQQSAMELSPKQNLRRNSIGKALERKVRTPEKLSAKTGDWNSETQASQPLRRVRSYGEFAVFGEKQLLFRTRSEVALRCDTDSEFLTLKRERYELAVGADELERQRMLFVLRAIPPTPPGGASQRTDSQLELLSKFVEGKDPLLSDMPRSTLMQVMGAATLMSSPKDHVLFKQGARGDKFYAVLEGKVAVHVSFTGKDAAGRECEEPGSPKVDDIKRSLRRLWQEEKSGNQKKISKAVSRGTVDEKMFAVQHAHSVLAKNLSWFESHDNLGQCQSTLGVGTIFGAKTLLKEEARTASIRTLEQSKFMIVSRDDFVAIMKARLESDIKGRMGFLRTTLPGYPSGHMSERDLEQLQRAANCVTPAALPRGKILVREGDVNSQSLWLLRHGSLAVHAPKSEACRRRGPVFSARSPVTRVRCYASGSGQMAGASAAVLGLPEPATISVESAAADAYWVNWAAIKKLLPPRVIVELENRARAAHNRCCSDDPRAVVGQCAINALADNSDLKVKAAGVDKAWESFFEAAHCFDAAEELEPGRVGCIGCGFGDGMKAKIVRASEKLAEDSQEFHEKMLQSEVAYAQEVDKALSILEQNDCQTNGHLRPVDPSKCRPQPPQDTSKERLRAVLVEMLAQGSSTGFSSQVTKILNKAMHDPLKDDVNAWVQKYMLDPRICNAMQMQDLRLLLRKHNLQGGGGAAPHLRRPASAQPARPSGSRARSAGHSARPYQKLADRAFV